MCHTTVPKFGLLLMWQIKIFFLCVVCWSGYWNILSESLFKVSDRDPEPCQTGFFFLPKRPLGLPGTELQCCQVLVTTKCLIPGQIMPDL